MPVPSASLSGAIFRDLETLVARRMPAGVSVAAGPIVRHPLCQAEEALIQHAVPKRQAEFSTGRTLAHLVLGKLGHQTDAIGIGPLRNPIWPTGIRGSISHDGGCCVALAGKDAVPSMGLDLMHMPTNAARMEGLLSMYLADADELTRLPDLEKPLTPEMALFSLKESIVKALVTELDDFVDLREISVQRPWGRICGPHSKDRRMTLWIDRCGPFLLTGAVYAP